jgi:4-amino-4-deoxy-L-arabinose transferase-like glycosyltransferase
VQPRPGAGLWRIVLRHRWALAFAAVVCAIAVRNLVGLSTTPSGLYADEVSIGYNAWTIAHFGVDEHGATLPLFFQAFGEWKNPVYIYVLVPFVWLFGLTTAVVRTPAALFGILTAIALAGFARRATGSKGVALATLLIAGANPWLTLLSRVAFEVPAMVACLAVMLWCLARAAEEPTHRRWFGFAGVALAVGVFAYTVGRLEGALLAAAVVLCFSGWRLLRRLDAFIVAMLVAYLLLALWAMGHPGQLTFYFNSISIAAGHPPLWTVVGRFVGNMAAYFGPGFLFVSGDPDLRQSTGFGGELLVATLPLLVAGIVVCIRRWREPLPRFVLIGLVLAPIAAALTNEGTPHALRDATALPFWIAITAYGMDGLRPLLGRRQAWRVVAVALAVAVAAETALFTVDLFGGYTTRSAVWFGEPEMAAISRAHAIAGDHTVWLSSELKQPYVYACFVALPAPPGHAVGGASVDLELAEAGFREIPGSAARAPARAGDLLVLAAAETPPPGSVPVFSESEPEVSRSGAGATEVLAVRVWRAG